MEAAAAAGAAVSLLASAAQPDATHHDGSWGSCIHVPPQSIRDDGKERHFACGFSGCSHRFRLVVHAEKCVCYYDAIMALKVSRSYVCSSFV